MNENDPLKDVDPVTVLRLFEADIALRRYKQAEECLFWLLSNCPVHVSLPNKVVPLNYDEREVVHVTTRIASGICQMFSDPAYGIEDKDFYKYAIGHGSLTAILGVSGFGSADHVVQNLLEPVEAKKSEVVTRQTFNKILLLHGVHSEIKIPFEDYIQSHPRHILWMVILAVATLFCVTERVNNARDNLIRSLIHKLDIKAFEASMLGWLCIAWMHCSYATISERNQVKKSFNRMLVFWMESLGIKQDQSSKSKAIKGKPVLLVINEYFKSGHAMYRCYAPTIEALRQHFHVVGMTKEKDCDDNSVKCFDEHFFLEWGEDVRQSLKRSVQVIKNISPTAIYYPSVGMQIPAILLSNLRLAPCQFMSMGHPASSHSDVMDYCLVEDQFVADRRQFSETLFALEDNASKFVPHVGQPPRQELLSWKKPLLPGEPVRIIITGSSMKINAGFIGTLAEIESKAQREVEFHFIPNLNNLGINLFRKQLALRLKRFVVHPSMDYKRYLSFIARCQIHFSPFPFGSTNSLVDSMLVGLPLVVLRVTDSELQIDAGMIDKLNVDGLRPSVSVEEYIAFACRLIDSSEERDHLTQLIEQKDVESIFFGSHPGAIERSAHGILEMVQHHK